MEWRTVDSALMLPGRSTDWHARLKSLIKGGRRAANRDTHPFRGFKRDQVTRPVPKYFHRSSVLLR